MKGYIPLRPRRVPAQQSHEAALQSCWLAEKPFLFHAGPAFARPDVSLVQSARPLGHAVVFGLGNLRQPVQIADDGRIVLPQRRQQLQASAGSSSRRMRLRVNRTESFVSS